MIQHLSEAGRSGPSTVVCLSYDSRYVGKVAASGTEPEFADHLVRSTSASQAVLAVSEPCLAYIPVSAKLRAVPDDLFQKNRLLFRADFIAWKRRMVEGRL